MSDITRRTATYGVALGAWLIVVAVLLSGPIDTNLSFAFGNYLAMGAAIAGLSGFAYWAERNDVPGESLAMVAIAGLGLWLMVLPFYTSVPTSRFLGWHDLLVGAATVYYGVTNAYAAAPFDLSPDTSTPNHVE